VNQLTVDVDDQVAVLRIKFLKHKRKINQEPRKAGKELKGILCRFLCSCFPDSIF
jgi:hypothetical protein